jgi:hypothetical protein
MAHLGLEAYRNGFFGELLHGRDRILAGGGSGVRPTGENGGMRALFAPVERSGTRSRRGRQEIQEALENM